MTTGRETAGTAKKVALVTGASAGIGEATAKRMIAAGYTVYAAARRLDRMQPLKAMGALLLPLDLTDDRSIGAAADQVRDQHGRIDVLLNNAGYGSYGAVEDVPLAEARRQFEVNVFGLARLIQLLTPMMRAQRSGKIVNVSSIAGRHQHRVGQIALDTLFQTSGHTALRASSGGQACPLPVGRRVGIGSGCRRTGDPQGRRRSSSQDPLRRRRIRQAVHLHVDVPA